MSKDFSPSMRSGFPTTHSVTTKKTAQHRGRVRGKKAGGKAKFSFLAVVF